MSNSSGNKRDFLGFVVETAGPQPEPAIARKSPAACIDTSDVRYNLPMPSLELVAKVNANAPSDSEFEIIES